jgi:hypothetical protein
MLLHIWNEKYLGTKVSRWIQFLSLHVWQTNKLSNCKTLVIVEMTYGELQQQ